jgi:uncharacterized membrane protein (UPF0127 family)
MAHAACDTGAMSNKREEAMPQPQKPGSAATQPTAPTPMVYLGTDKGDVPVKVEVVATEAKIEKGLMYRQHLPLDSGMLFMMGREHQWSFWMRNTLIPLDMIFIAKDMTIAGIVENAQPLTENLRQVDKPSFYVLEVNGGFTKSAGIVAGAKVRFENMPQ